MPYYDFLWNDEIIEHIAEHDITPEQFQNVVSHPESTDISYSTGAPCAFGETDDGRHIICIYDLEADGITVIPRSAYEVPRRGKR